MKSKLALFNTLLLVPTLLCTWTLLESSVMADSASKLNLGIWLPPMTLKLPKFNMPKIKISATIKPRKNQPPLKIHLPEVSLNAKALGDDDGWSYGGGHGGGGGDGGHGGYEGGHGGGGQGGGYGGGYGGEGPGQGGYDAPAGGGYAARSNDGYSSGGGGYAAASNERYRPTATSGYSAEPAPSSGAGGYGSSNNNNNNYGANNGGSSGYSGNTNSYGSTASHTASNYGGSNSGYGANNANANGGRYTTGSGYSNEQPVTIHQHQPAQYQPAQPQYQQPANQYSGNDYRQAEPRPTADEYSGYGSRLAPQPSTSYEATRPSGDYGDGPSGYGYAVSPQKRSYPSQAYQSPPTYGPTAAVPYSPQRSAAVTAATAATANQSQYQRRNHYDAAPASSSSSYEKIHIIPYVDSLPALYQMYAGKKMYSQKYLV